MRRFSRSRRLFSPAGRFTDGPAGGFTAKFSSCGWVMPSTATKPPPAKPRSGCKPSCSAGASGFPLKSSTQQGGVRPKGPSRGGAGGTLPSPPAAAAVLRGATLLRGARGGAWVRSRSRSAGDEVGPELEGTSALVRAQSRELLQRLQSGWGLPAAAPHLL